MAYQSDKAEKSAQAEQLKAVGARYHSGRIKLGEGGIPLPEYPAPLARRFQQICAALFAEALAGSDIVQLEFALLRIIAEMPGIEQWLLAEAIGIDRKNAGLIIDQLERKELIERRINGADRRARELFLTRKGHRKFFLLLPKIRIANERIMSPLSSSDQKRFIRLFARLVQGNGVYARPGAGRRKRGSAQSMENGSTARSMNRPVEKQRPDSSHR
jgi:DNA-binding MarR family transcriptional regulator